MLLPCLVYALKEEVHAGVELGTEHFRQEFLDILLSHVDVQERDRWDELNDLLEQRGLSDHERARWHKYLEGLGLLEEKGNDPVNPPPSGQEPLPPGQEETEVQQPLGIYINPRQQSRASGSNVSPTPIKFETEDPKNKKNK